MDMHPNIEGELREKAHKLQSLNDQIIESIDPVDIDKFEKAMLDYYGLKNEICAVLLDYPVAKLHDKEVRELLSQATSKEGLEIEILLADHLNDLGIKKKPHEIFDPYGFDEYDQLASDHLFSWFGPEAYIKNLFIAGYLILGTAVPSHFKKFVDQARQCFAFEQYLAVYSLCRTILEIAVRDVGQKKGILPRDKGKVKHDVLRRFQEMKRKVVPKSLREEVENIYDKASGLIHGNKTVKKSEAIDLLRRTLKVVQNLYI